MVYIFAFFLHIFYIFCTYNCIFYANNCIFLAFSAFLLHISAYFCSIRSSWPCCRLFLYPSCKQYNNRLVCTLHCLQARSDSPGYGNPGAPPKPVGPPHPAATWHCLQPHPHPPHPCPESQIVQEFWTRPTCY